VSAASQARAWDHDAEPNPAGYTDDMGEISALMVVDALTAMQDALGDTTHVNWACRYLETHGKAADMLTVVAALQDLRRQLAVAEAYVSLECGRALNRREIDKAGQLPDGRPYEVRRGKERKAWNYDEWQAAARAAVLRDQLGAADSLPEVVNTETGESVDLFAIASAVQAVHGAGPPRTTALKGLGLDPADYCEQVPGPWSVNVLTNDPKVDTGVPPA
jgi:hypothetical protein